MFYKKGAFGNFAEFTGRHPCWSLCLSKVIGWRLVTLLKRYSSTGVSSEFCEIIKYINFAKHIWNQLFLKFEVNWKFRKIHIKTLVMKLQVGER